MLPRTYSPPLRAVAQEFVGDGGRQSRNLRYTVPVMARSRSSSTARAGAETPADRLQSVVDEFAQNVRVLTDVVDQLREDLSWLTRNGVPHQPTVVFVERMPLVATGVQSESSLDLTFAQWPVRDPTAETLSDDRVRATVIDDVVRRLAEPLGELAQEQLNLLVSVMDHAHREILQAIRNPHATAAKGIGERPSRRRAVKESTQPGITSPPEEQPPPGQLF